MKSIVTARTILKGLVLFSISILLASGGCSDNPTETSEESQPITVEDIIINPKAPEPADTVLLTAIVSSSSPNIGDFPTYSWQTDGGQLLQDDKAQVKWLAPDTSAIYTLQVTASNSVSSDQSSADVFVTNITSLLAASAGELVLIPGGDSFYYLHSNLPPDDIFFEGFTIYLYSQGASSAVTSSNPGLNYVFSSTLSLAAHASEMEMPGASENPINIIITALPSGSQQQITQDQAHPLNPRKHQYKHPCISPDEQLVAYQAFKPDSLSPDQGGVDTLDIYVYNVNTMATHRVTTSHKNLFPSFSSDGAYLTFISDRDITGGWEVFAFPVSGGAVDTSASSLVQLSHSGGLIIFSPTSDKPLAAWNPNPASPFMAMVGADSKLRLIGADGTGDAVQGISAEVVDMCWSSDGTALAVSTGAEIYSVSINRTSQLLHLSLDNDIMADIIWSDDGQYILYNLQRFGNTWFELLDVGGALNLSVPIKLTSTAAANKIQEYRSVASLKPLWISISKVYALIFDSPTPGVKHMDLSGLTK